MHELPEPQQQQRHEPQDPPATSAGQSQGYPVHQQSQPYQQQEQQQLRQATQQTPDAAATYPPYPPYLPYPQPTPGPGQEAQQLPQYAAAGYPPPPPAGPGAYPAIPPAGLSSCPTSAGGPQPYTPQQQQQQQQQQPPALGIPMLGQSAAYVYQHPVWGPDEQTRDSRFAFVAWLIFVLGFFMPIFWLVSVLLPCCVPGRHVRWAATASFLASLAYLIVGVVMGIVGHSMRGRMN
ncbi:hypothetical protein Vafri_17273 [Volvox africanus]|uniref:Uncharacterized protein n=1 Tax=Volvox africanus TaxID=51714 RepID=A0A8J4BJY6_9CHLO|nr:hypothetical protein Vafri_17273 [Volvox africanus]